MYDVISGQLSNELKNKISQIDNTECLFYYMSIKNWNQNQLSK